MILDTPDREKGLYSLHFAGHQIGQGIHRISNWDCWISDAFTSVCGSTLEVMFIDVAWTQMRA
jgi:hypothetical protein